MDLFPELCTNAWTDVILFGSPKKSRDQLKKLVQFAKDNGSILVYDSAYARHISDDSPGSIYKILGAHEDAIVTATSFSKYAGFTGNHLDWTVVPMQLLFTDGFPVAKESAHALMAHQNLSSWLPSMSFSRWP